MLIRIGEERTITVDLYLSGLLSCIAGALNAVGFSIAGAFTANMTGNVSAFADHLARGALWAALSFAGLVLAFVAGAAAAGVALQWGARRRITGVYALAIVAEGVLLCALGLWMLHRPTPLAEPLQVLVLSFVMGLQNAVSTMISAGRVRTTHVSGMATDLGIELAALTCGPGERRAALPKLRLHGVTLLSFALGGVAGAVLHAMVGAWLFVLAAAALLALALPELVLARRRRRRASARE